ncbi:MAG: alpha/beta fold hydrolase [Pseudomonadota bacterium]
MRLICLVMMCLPAMSWADPVRIPGPQGPLEAEQITVDGAEHAVVIIPGSGPTNRDGNAPQMGMASDTLKLLAEGLAEEGVASLRIDKRGFFGSAAAIADPNDVTIEAYAEDARAWVEKAASLAPCTWIAGHSEGGLVALVAAQEPPENLCGLILLATPGRPIGQLMVEQFAANPANEPLMPDIRAIVSDLEQGQTRDPISVPQMLRPLFSDGLQRFMINLFSHDPRALAQQWKGPTLIVQGAADFQVKLLDANLLFDAMPQARQLILRAGTHMLKANVPGAPFATYTDPELPLFDGLTSDIATFLNDHTPAE